MTPIHTYNTSISASISTRKCTCETGWRKHKHAYPCACVAHVRTYFLNPTPHSRHRLAVTHPAPYVQCSLHLLKARTMMDIYTCHILICIIVFLTKSLLSITLILICKTLPLITLLGNYFSFHFIAVHYERSNFFLCLRLCLHHMCEPAKKKVLQMFTALLFEILFEIHSTNL